MSREETGHHAAPSPQPAGARVTVSRPWRDRLIYLVMSLFVGWHALAIVVGPAPEDSPHGQSLHALFWPYLTLFRLESTWAFFTTIPRLSQFRYVIQDADGNEHTFVPVDEFRWYNPRSNWFERIYWSIMGMPETFGQRAAASLCRQHAALKPVFLTLQQVQQVHDFRPEHQLRGQHPLDPEFATTQTLMIVDC